jgi:hypothetical protein
MTPTPNRTPIETEISSLDDFEAFARTNALTIDELSKMIEKVWRYWIAKDKIKTPEHLLELFLKEERERERLSRECKCFIERRLFLP